MTTDDIHEYFDFNWARASRELRLGVNTYQGWLKNGYVPMATQIKIEKMTQGKLKSDLTKFKEQNEVNELRNKA